MRDLMVSDIHSHMIYDVDDGSDNFEMTKSMIRMSINEGCRHIFMTPHSGALTGKNKIIKKFQTIREWIETEELEIEIYLGSEIYVDNDEYEKSIKSIIKNLKKGKYYTLNNTRYVLIEFYLGGFTFEEIAPMVAALLEEGYIPVIAHAERYGVSFETLYKLKSMGCMIQINLSNVYFIYRHDVVEMANRLLREEMVDFVGTDAHGIDRRKPEIRTFAEYLYKEYPEKYIDDILIGNAVKYLRGI